MSKLHVVNRMTTEIESGDGLHVPLQKETAKIEYVKSNIEQHTFSTISDDLGIIFQVLKMEQSVFIWIGSPSEPSFADLSLAMSSNYNKSPLTSKLLGGACDTVSLNFSSKLSKKLGITVYVSFNLSTDNRIVIENVEKRIQEEIKTNPQKFK